MFCTQCGVQLGDPEPNFCPACGKSTGPATYSQFAPPRPRLERPREGRWIAGVCAGFAQYFDVDVTLMRLLAVIAMITGMGFIAYIVAIIVMPNEEYRPFQDSVRTN